MHIVQLKLNTTAQNVRSLNKRFYEMSHIHNVIVKYGMTQLNASKDDPEYNELFDVRKTASKSKKEATRVWQDVNKCLFSNVRLYFPPVFSFYDAFLL